MKEYGQEVIDYQKLYGVFERKHKREQEIQEKLRQIDQNLSLLKNGYRYKIRQFQKNGIAFPFIQEMEQMKFARSYQQNTLLKQEINQLKRNKSMDTRIQRTIDSSRLILSFGSTCLLQSQTSRTADERYNELSEMLTPLFPEELTKRNYL